jgi:hypothetical protein
VAITTLHALPAATSAPLLELDRATREVRVRGRPVALTPTEHTLLEALAEHPGAVLTKTRLLRDVWGFKLQGRTRTVDTHACRLRRTLGDPRLVLTVRGVGYRLCRPADAHLVCLGERPAPARADDVPARPLGLAPGAPPDLPCARIVLAAPGAPAVLVAGTRAATHDLIAAALVASRGLVALPTPAGPAVSLNPIHVALVTDASDPTYFQED